jgi:uncharacterized protein with PIN domain
MIEVTIRAYGPLNDFLPPHRRQIPWLQTVPESPRSVKDPIESLGVPEVLRRFGPLDLHPFSRCLRCNGVLRDVGKPAVDAALLPRTRRHDHEFRACAGCRRVYWKGSHWSRLQRAIDAAREEAVTPRART